MSEFIKFIGSLLTIALLAVAWFGFLVTTDNPTRRDLGLEPASNAVSNHLDDRRRFSIIDNRAIQSDERIARTDGEACLFTDKRCNKR